MAPILSSQMLLLITHKDLIIKLLHYVQLSHEVVRCIGINHIGIVKNRNIRQPTVYINA